MNHTCWRMLMSKRLLNEGWFIDTAPQSACRTRPARAVCGHWWLLVRMTSSAAVSETTGRCFSSSFRVLWLSWWTYSNVLTICHLTRNIIYLFFWNYKVQWYNAFYRILSIIYFFEDAQETPNYKRILFYFLKLKSL